MDSSPSGLFARGPGRQDPCVHGSYTSISLTAIQFLKVDPPPSLVATQSEREEAAMVDEPEYRSIVATQTLRAPPIAGHGPTDSGQFVGTVRISPSVTGGRFVRSERGYRRLHRESHRSYRRGWRGERRDCEPIPLMRDSGMGILGQPSFFTAQALRPSRPPNPFPVRAPAPPGERSS